MFDDISYWLREDANRIFQFVYFGGDLAIRLNGKMADGRRMTKFFPIVPAGDMVKSEEYQIRSAIQEWKKEAGVER